MSGFDIRAEIVKAGGVLKGNYFFALKEKGRIATEYVNVDPVFTFPHLVESLGIMMIERWKWTAEVVAGPAVGGIPLVYAAANVSRLHAVRTVWADKQKDGSFAFERMRFMEAVRGRQALVVEDVTSSGSSARSVGKLIEDAGGTVLAYAFVWNRGGVTEEKMGAPVHSLVEERIPSFAITEHSMWGLWPLVTDIGHPDYYPDYPGPRVTLLK